MVRKNEGGAELLDQKPAAKLALIDSKLLDQALTLDRTAAEFAGAISRAEGHVQRALLTARGIAALRQALTSGPLMAEIMALMNSPLGFLTDKGTERAKDKTPYDVAVVRDCLIESLLQGLYPVGNEWNIISGRCYVTLAGWRRKLEELPGLTDLRVAAGVPVIHQGQTVCRVAVSWKLDGQVDELRGTDGKPGIAFPVSVNSYSSADQIAGKAKRKALKAAYEQATGTRCTMLDGEVGDPVERPGLPSRSDDVAGRLGVNGEPAVTQAQRDTIDSLVLALEMDGEAFAAYCRERGIDPAKMTSAQAEGVVHWLTGLQRQPAQG